MGVDVELDPLVDAEPVGCVAVEDLDPVVLLVPAEELASNRKRRRSKLYRLGGGNSVRTGGTFLLLEGKSGCLLRGRAL